MNQREGTLISHVDPRVIRTNERLRQALSVLLEDHQLKEVSVQTLTKTAQITRGTFYLHYKDKADFLLQTERQVVDEWFFHAETITAITDTNTPAGVLQVTGFDLNAALEYADKHHQILATLFDTQFPRFREYLLSTLIQKLYEFGLNFEGNRQNFHMTENEIPASYLASAFMGMVMQWLADDRRFSYSHLGRSFAALLPSPEATRLREWFITCNLEK